MLNRNNRDLLGTIPERWGRMDAMSRAVLVETGRVLRVAGLTTHDQHSVSPGLVVGLICGSRRGSLASDLAYGRTMTENASFASPALFSYTLPNIPLAEAAIHYRLTGPVFALLSRKPYQEAVATARQWMACCFGLHGLLAGEYEQEQGGGLVSGLKLHDITAGDIGDDTPLFDRELGLDSLDAVEMVVLVKKKYGVQIKDMNEGQLAFASINSLAQFIRERQSAL